MSPHYICFAKYRKWLKSSLIYFELTQLRISGYGLRPSRGEETNEGDSSQWAGLRPPYTTHYDTAVTSE
jgi:hypothetical protein